MNELIEFEKELLNSTIPNFEFIDEEYFYGLDGQMFKLAIFDNEGFGIYILNNKKQASKWYEASYNEEMYRAMKIRLHVFFELYQERYSKMTITKMYNDLLKFNQQFNFSIKKLK